MFASGEGLGSSFISSVLEQRGIRGGGNWAKRGGFWGGYETWHPTVHVSQPTVLWGTDLGWQWRGAELTRVYPLGLNYRWIFSLHSKQIHTLPEEGTPKGIRFEIQDLVLASAAGPDLISLDPDAYERKTKSIYILFDHMHRPHPTHIHIDHIKVKETRMAARNCPIQKGEKWEVQQSMSYSNSELPLDKHSL